MKFIVDQGIPVSAIAFLREAGHDVLHVREAGLNQLPDEDILKAAIREQRVVVTHDLDFPRLVALSGGALPSIIPLSSEGDEAAQGRDVSADSIPGV
jgi:predicted nuclease of predicted toxin-antitoxin system